MRVSVLKALPTDDEIQAAECSNAFEYLKQLRANDEDEYKALLRDRQTEWGHVSTFQPVARCVFHLCVLIIGTIEEHSAGVDNQLLTEQEVAQWVKHHMN